MNGILVRTDKCGDRILNKDYIIDVFIQPLSIMIYLTNDDTFKVSFDNVSQRDNFITSILA